MSWSVRRIDEVLGETAPDAAQFGQLAPWCSATTIISHDLPEWAKKRERIGDCKGCGHQYTTIAAIYTCEYCGRKA